MEIHVFDHITGLIMCVGSIFLFEEHSERLNEVKNSNQMLAQEDVALQQRLREKEELIKEMKIERERLELENKKCFEDNLLLENKLQQLKERLAKLEKDYEDTLLEFGRLSIESDSKTNKSKENKKFREIFPQKQSASPVLNMEGNLSSDFSPTSTVVNSDVKPNIVQSEGGKKPLPALFLPSSSGEQSVGADGELVELSPCQNQVTSNNVSNATNESIHVSPDSTPLPTEVYERSKAEPLGLLNVLSSSVSAHVYNAYKLLLLTLSDMLLYSDIIKLKEWANRKFSIDSNLSRAKIILQLDQKGVINASDVGQLRVFFESITRFDLVYLIDEFYNGDYDKLRKLFNQHKSIKNSHKRMANLNRVHSSRVLPPDNNTPRSPLMSNTVNRVSNVEVFERPSTADENNGVSIVRNSQRTENGHSNVGSTNVATISGNRFSTHENSEDVPDCPAVNNTRGW